MTCDDIVTIDKSGNDICIWGCGKIGTGDGYRFISALLPNRIKCFYDSNISAGTSIIDNLRTVDFEYIKSHQNNMTIIVMVANYSGIVEVLEKNHISNFYVLDEAMLSDMVPLVATRDEQFIKRIDDYRNNKSVEIQIETTSFCNAKCKFCPNSSLKRTKNVMTDKTFDLIIERIKKERILVREFILHLNGEPLTDTSIIQRVKKIKVEFPNSRVRFTTNFSLADEHIIDDILDSGLDCLTISLNAVNSEEYRDIMNLDYKTTINNISLLLEQKKKINSNLEVILSIVETKDNSEAVRIFEQQWAQYGAKVRVMKLGNWVGETQNELGDITVEPCKALYNTINILSNGDYALCCFDAEGVIKKNIQDTPILEAWNDDRLREIRKTHLVNGRVNKECRECNII